MAEATLTVHSEDDSSTDNFVVLDQPTNIMSKVRVGAVQAEPGWLDLEESVEKTISLINQAADKGVNVLCFPEVWIPGYPWFVQSTMDLPISNDAVSWSIDSS